MEKRIGAIVVLVENKAAISSLNLILSDFSSAILARQGLPIRDKGIHVITLIVEASTDEVGALSGRIGRLSGVQVKSVLTKFVETSL